MKNKQPLQKIPAIEAAAGATTTASAKAEAVAATPTQGI